MQKLFTAMHRILAMNFLRNAIAKNDYRGTEDVDICADEIFVSDGAKE